MKQNDETTHDESIGGPSTPKAEEPNQPPAASDQGDGAGDGKQAEAPIEEEVSTK